MMIFLDFKIILFFVVKIRAHKFGHSRLRYPKLSNNWPLFLQHSKNIWILILHLKAYSLQATISLTILVLKELAKRPYFLGAILVVFWEDLGYLWAKRMTIMFRCTTQETVILSVFTSTFKVTTAVLLNRENTATRANLILNIILPNNRWI